jgi:hypothetical protein
MGRTFTDGGSCLARRLERACRERIRDPAAALADRPPPGGTADDAAPRFFEPAN